MSRVKDSYRPRPAASVVYDALLQGAIFACEPLTALDFNLPVIANTFAEGGSHQFRVPTRCSTTVQFTAP
jgi:hypothetical protein